MKTDKPAYRLFSQKGKSATYSDLLKDALKADLVFFGELHDVSICHWLEYELMADLHKERGENLVLGAEMFESDNQLIVDEYLAGRIKDKNFESEARIWPNYKTDYKPLLTFARDSSLRFIATNIPKRYAAMVNKGGFEQLEGLHPEALEYIAPLPVKFDTLLACYRDIVKNIGDAPSHVTSNIAKAQAIKDATMAHFILLNLEPGKTFLHFNGTYHSDNFESIVWYIRQAKSELNILTISTAEQNSPEELEESNKGRGDYILVIPKSMTRTQ
jgi:uncharacterized iron-regulated protein